jgi:Fe-S-cluster containining protein
MTDLQQFKKESEAAAAENKKFLKGLKKVNDRELDRLFHTAHDEVFEETDCLKCANCCKTTSPIFYQTDIDRMAPALKMRPGDFIEKYLRVDEDKDYVLKSAPCPFLMDDNYCSVYEHRPKACREYPHTDRRKVSQILDLTYRNTLVCPAVLKILGRVRDAMAGK